MNIPHRKLEVHGLSDASLQAYSAFIYIRFTDADGNVQLRQNRVPLHFTSEVNPCHGALHRIAISSPTSSRYEKYFPRSTSIPVTGFNNYT